MHVYVAVLSVASLVAALCAGFILASSPRQRATQLASSLAAGASWWALCEVRWNVTPDPDVALLWMRLSAPGWCFLGGVVPHLMARYLDMYPGSESEEQRSWLQRFAILGYAAGAVVLALTGLGYGVHGDLLRVPWGWTYQPGPVLPVFLGVILAGVTYTVIAMHGHMQSPVSVAPRAHRISIRTGILLPVVLTPLTDIVLPAAGIHVPRLGSTAYALFGLVALGTGLRYGMTFFTPKQFSEEILEAIDEGVVMITPRGLIRRANRGFAELVGRPAETLGGTDLSQWLDWTPPDKPSAVEEQQGRLIGEKGEGIPVSVSATPLQDRRGNALGLVVVLRDLREIEELRRHMLIQARLAAVGELVAGLAHEINNPLAFVRSNLALLDRHTKALEDPGAVSDEERSELAQETREIIEESLTGVDRAVEIVRGVRRFTHAGTPDREDANLNELLEDAISMLRPRVHPPEVTITLEPQPLPSVSCAPHELRQVFLNLMVNALDAIGSQGHVVASSRIEGAEAVVEIRDDGCGMDPETIERIFDPFFTTKRVGEGTGLGLGIAWNIVRAQGGQIEVRSKPGEGSSFRVRLPMPENDWLEAD